MPLRKAEGDMYGFVSHIWNPVKGKCGYDCSYCYMKKMARFPHIASMNERLHSLDEKELTVNLRSGNYIFVCSSTDLFHKYMPNDWIWRVIDYTKGFSGNSYLWHTKNPERALEFQDRFGENDMLCVTIESDRHYAEISQAPSPFERLEALWEWRKPWMLTMEPVMDFSAGGLGMMMLEFVKDNMPVQVNIGANSGRNNLPEPSPEKLRALIDWLELWTKVHLKKNLGRLLKA